jgi:hypothetical protein
MVPASQHISSKFLIPVKMFTTGKDLKETRPDVLKSRWQRPSNAIILRGLYIVTSCLCGFMVSWILIYPAVGLSVDPPFMKHFWKRQWEPTTALLPWILP